MQGYRQNPDWGWESLATEGTAGVMVVAIVLAAILVTILIAIVKEVARIYLARAFQPTKTARILWLALAGLGTAWLVAVVLANLGMVSTSVYLASWSFLTFVVVVEGCDLYERRYDQEPVDELADPDRYLGAFIPAESEGTASLSRSR